MLSDEDRERIYDEEEARAAARVKIEQRKESELWLRRGPMIGATVLLCALLFAAALLISDWL